MSHLNLWLLLFVAASLRDLVQPSTCAAEVIFSSMTLRVRNG